MYKGCTKLEIGKLSVKDLNVKDSGTMGHYLKLSKLGCARDIRKYFLSYLLVVGHWNALDQHSGCT